MVTVYVLAGVATDTAGNGNTEATPASSTYTAPDTTAPRVTSIERKTPPSSPTNADDLVWWVTFSEAVSNVNAADFSVTGTTATHAAFKVTAMTRVYAVIVSGGDLAGLDATVTLAFASGQDIEDAAGNALTNTTPTGTNENDYVVDNTAPRVASIERNNPSLSPTNADSLIWRVTFDEAVTGVESGDFSVTGTAGNVLSVQRIGTTSTYLIGLSGGDLAGLDATVTLAFASGQDIEDAAGNALTNTTPTGTNEDDYVVDNTAPTVTIGGVPTASGAAFTATFTFSEDVTGFVVGDIGLGNATASNFTSTTDRVYTALITPTATGTVTVDVADDVAEDEAGNANTAATRASSTYTAPIVDTTAPRVTSIERQTPSTSPTNADSLTWRVTFSEAVSNVGTADFSVTGTTATLAVTGSGTTYDVTASGGNLAGLDATVTLAFASGQDIEDAAGNALTNTTPTGTNENDYVVDNTAPRVASIKYVSPTSSPTNEDRLIWWVMFDEAVSNVHAADFSVTGTTGITDAVRVSAITYQITVDGGNLAGLDATVTLAFASGQDIEDAAGNALTNTTPTGTNENSYRVDNTAPTVMIGGVPTTSSAAFTATFTFSEDVTGFVVGDIGLGNATASNFTSTTARVYTALITPAADGTVTVDVDASEAEDEAGNGNTAATRASSTYTAAPANTAPEFAAATATRSVAENTAADRDIGAPVGATDDDGDTLEYSLSGTDAPSFSIDASTGQLKTGAALDFETKSSYSVTVGVSDSKDSSGNADTVVDDTIDVTITVTNEEEAGRVALSSNRPVVGIALTARLSDPDGTPSGVTWQWSSSATAGGTFRNISGATSASYTPVAGDVGDYLRATARYTDPEASGKRASATTARSVTSRVGELTLEDRLPSGDCRDLTSAGPNCGIGSSIDQRAGGYSDGGAIQSAGDGDLWSVILYRAQSYLIEVKGAGDPGGDNGGTLPDPRVEIYEMSWSEQRGWSGT